MHIKGKNLFKLIEKKYSVIAANWPPHRIWRISKVFGVSLSQQS